MENINWKEIFKNTIEDAKLEPYQVRNLGRQLEEYHKLACKEQKKICVESAFINIKEYILDDNTVINNCDFDINENSILNAPIVKFN